MNITDLLPFLLPIKRKDAKLVKLLITSGADVNKGYNHYGYKSPLEAAVYSTPEIMRMLLEHKASTYYDSALAMAAFNASRYSQNHPHYQEAYNIFTLLVNYYAELHIQGLLKDKFYQVLSNDPLFATLLHVTRHAEDYSIEEFKRIASFIHTQGATINTVDQEDKSLLVNLAVNSAINVDKKDAFKKMQFLLDQGADINLQNKDGDTFLHFLVRLERYMRNKHPRIHAIIYRKMIDFALSHGANTSVKNNLGHTAFSELNIK